MTWWGWLLQVAGLLMLGAAVALAVRKSLGGGAVPAWSLLVAAASSTFAAFLFIFLSPAGPGAALVVTLSVLGLALGSVTPFLDKPRFEGGNVSSPVSRWYMAAWLSVTLLSSLLVIAGSAGSKTAVALMSPSSFFVTGYSVSVYSLYVVGSRGAEPVGHAAGSPARFCTNCGAQLAGITGAQRFCERCGNPV